MRIFTGYFGKLKEYEKAGLFPIAICLSAPFFKGFFYKDLAPKYSYKDLPEEKYTTKFRADLMTLSPYKVLSELETISMGKDVVLLCYEVPTDFCHRHLVAKYLEWANPALTVMEYGCEDINEKKTKNNSSIQGTLF